MTFFSSYKIKKKNSKQQKIRIHWLLVDYIREKDMSEHAPNWDSDLTYAL